MRVLGSGPVIVNSTTNSAGDIFSSYTGGLTLGTQAISGYGFSNNSIGIYGQSNNVNGLGIKAFNSDPFGTALVAGGNNISSVFTIGNGGGAAFAGTEVGSFSYATDLDIGTGVMGNGNNISLPTFYSLGSGGAFTGNYCGVYGEAIEQYYNLPNGSWGGIFRAKGFAPLYVGVAGWFYDGSVWVQYKIKGPGTVSTIVKDLNNKSRVMFCPEAPEVLFQDYGTGKLTNGRTHITLDPILTKNILVDDKHPLKVFIQLKGDCKGTYVTNETANGFDVIELQGGISDAEFNWSITATRQDDTIIDEKDGSKMVSSYSKVRFPLMSEPTNINGLRTKTINTKKSVLLK